LSEQSSASSQSSSQESTSSEESTSSSQQSTSSEAPTDTGPDWCVKDGINTWDAPTQTCLDPMGNVFPEPQPGGTGTGDETPPWCMAINVVWDWTNGVCRNSDDGSIVSPPADADP